ncbi:MAG: PilZ domain-containing protein [Methylohalobius sp.]
MAEDFISPLAAPFYALLVLILLGFVLAFWRWHVFPGERPMLLITGFWNLASLLILVAGLGALYERRQRRRHPRLPAGNLPARLELGSLSFEVLLRDVSVGGAGLSGVPARLALGERGYLGLEHPVLNRPFRIKVEIVDQLKAESLGVRFLPASLEEYRALVLLVYGDSRRWQAILAHRQREVGITRAFLVLVAYAFRQASEHLAALWKLALKRRETHASILEPGVRAYPELKPPSRRTVAASGEADALAGAD